MNQGEFVCPHNLLQIDKQLHEAQFYPGKVTVPTRVTLAGKETVVSNPAAKTFFEKLTGLSPDQKELIMEEEASHLIIQDNMYWKKVATETMQWQDNIARGLKK